MYDELIKCLGIQGIQCVFQKPTQLVVAASLPHYPQVNSFWVAKIEDNWYLSTWLPAVYRVPANQNICKVCTDVLRSSQTAIYKVDQVLIAKYQLVRLAANEADALFEEV